VAEILWNAALFLEEGDLDDALERLRQAQERLSEAMRQGASDEEIAQLMQELREAMNDYMRQLAENAEPGDRRPTSPTRASAPRCRWPTSTRCCAGSRS
jgi:uncharacterized membrane protein YccC